MKGKMLATNSPLLNFTKVGVGYVMALFQGFPSVAQERLWSGEELPKRRQLGLKWFSALEKCKWH